MRRISILIALAAVLVIGLAAPALQAGRHLAGRCGGPCPPRAPGPPGGAGRDRGARPGPARHRPGARRHLHPEPAVPQLLPRRRLRPRLQEPGRPLRVLHRGKLLRLLLEDLARRRSTSVLRRKYGALAGEPSTLLARRADAGILGVFRGGATPPGA